MAPGAVIVFFDGGCGLCHGLVRFLLARDRAGAFRFAALDSAAAQALLGPGDRAGDTLVVTVAGRVRTRSEAVLEIARRLPAPWRWAAAARILPRGLRDAAYDLVARNRHRWRRDPGCLVRPPGREERFLE